LLWTYTYGGDSMSQRESFKINQSGWVGKCTKCNLWRTADHTIINRITGSRFCMFDGAPIHLKCESCMTKDTKLCEDCGGTGMDYPPTNKEMKE